MKLTASFYEEARATVAYAIKKGWARYPQNNGHEVMPPRGKMKIQIRGQIIRIEQ